MEPPSQPPAPEAPVQLTVSGQFSVENLPLEVVHPVLGWRVKLKPEQRKTVAELLNIYTGDTATGRPAMTRAINASMLGAGKTPMTLYLCAFLGLMPVVYCPASVVPQWEAEMTADRNGNPRNFPLFYYVSNATPFNGVHAIVKCKAVNSYNIAILPIARQEQQFPVEDTVFSNVPITHGLHSQVTTRSMTPNDPINVTAHRIVNGLKPGVNPWLNHIRDEFHEVLDYRNKKIRQHRYYTNDTGNNGHRHTIPVYMPPINATQDPNTGVIHDGFGARYQHKVLFEASTVFHAMEDAQGVIVQLNQPGQPDVTFATIPIMVIFDEFQRVKNDDTSNNAMASAISARLAKGGPNFFRGGQHTRMGYARACFLSATPFDNEKNIFNIVLAMGLIGSGKSEIIKYSVADGTYTYNGLMELVNVCSTIDPNATYQYMNTVHEDYNLTPAQGIAAGEEGRPGGMDASDVKTVAMGLFCAVIMRRMTALMPTGGDPSLNHRRYNGYMRIGLDPNNPIDQQRWENYKDAVALLGDLQRRFNSKDEQLNKAVIMKQINQALFNIEASKMTDLTIIIKYITDYIPRCKCVVFLRSVSNIDTLIGNLHAQGITVAAIMGKQSKNTEDTGVKIRSTDNIKKLGERRLLGDDSKRRKAIVDMFTPSRALRDEQIRSLQYNYRPIQVMIVNITAGAEGINLDDKIGDTPPFEFITSSYNFLNAVQASGRCIRNDSASPATVFNMYGSSPDTNDIDPTEMAPEVVASNAITVKEERIINSISAKSKTLASIMGLYEEFGTVLPKSWNVVHISAIIDRRIEEFRQTHPDAFKPWSEEIQRVLSTPAPTPQFGGQGGPVAMGGNTGGAMFGGPVMGGMYQGSTSSTQRLDPFGRPM